MDFDPNSKPKEAKPQVWATYVPTRSPKFKTYSNRGHAINALGYVVDAWGYGRKPGGILYQWINEQWVEVDRYEPKENCDHCGDPFALHGGNHMLYRDQPKGLPKWHFPVVCELCWEKHFCYYDKQLPEPLTLADLGRKTP